MQQQTPGSLEIFESWFERRGWTLYPHQRAMINAAAEQKSVLLIAPTGGGKTLAGFLPTLLRLISGDYEGLHTLYISPLKALTADVERNLFTPIKELDLNIRVETRTGDTSSSRKKRQFKKPPHILLTTPESLEILLSYPDARQAFGTVQRVIIDEIHALAPGKRGHLTALCVAQLRTFNPHLSVAGLSATVAKPEELADWIGGAIVIKGAETVKPKVRMLKTEARIPWGGYMGTYAVKDIYTAIEGAQTAIVFVNTRAQAEWLFQQIWLHNTEDLPIALHHGSLDREHRVKVENRMAAGGLRAIIATASLDLGLDWGAVDLVIQVGAPKGISRLLQRIGRSNHRYNEPSAAVLVPTNRFETLECVAVMQAIADGERDGEPLRQGSLDVLVQFIMNRACAGPFDEKVLFEEVRRASPYNALKFEDFQACIGCVAHGGFSLKVYERFQRITRNELGLWEANPLAVRRHRMNTGTIVEYETIPVALRQGKSAFPRSLGLIEEFFVQGLAIGDTFLFGGQLLKYMGIRDDRVMAEKAKGSRPKIPSFLGGKLPLSLALAERVLDLLGNAEGWNELPTLTQEWLQIQAKRSQLPNRETLLIETFPHEKLHYTVVYSFSGRNGNQTLGLLMTRRMEESDLMPLGFVASDYALALWGLREVDWPENLVREALKASSIEDWIENTQMSKRAFREVAVIAGLVERNYAGRRKSGRQVTISTDLIYEVLKNHEPGHVLLTATREDVENRIADTHRLNEQILPLTVVHVPLDRPSPLAIPLMLEIGTEQVRGKAEQELLSFREQEVRRDRAGDLLLARTSA